MKKAGRILFMARQGCASVARPARAGRSRPHIPGGVIIAVCGASGPLRRYAWRYWLALCGVSGAGLSEPPAEAPESAQGRWDMRDFPPNPWEAASMGLQVLRHPGTASDSV